MSGAPLRLLMTADAVGGVWSYAVDLAAALRPHDVATTIAVMGPGASPGQRAEARAAGADLVAVDGPLDWTAADREALVAPASTLAALARARGADVVQLNAPALAALARFDAPTLGVCHSDLASWWTAVRGGSPPADFGWRIDLAAAGYRACDALVAPSHAFAVATRDHYGVDPLVVLNGRSPAPSQPAATRVPGSILAAGRLWDDGKGIAVLDAAAGLMRARPSVAGPLNGPHGHGIALHHVEALGPLPGPALRARLRETAIFVSPALYEPFGLTALEAAEAGTALVLSDIPTHRELWDGAATFVPPRDPAALAATLDALAIDPARTARAGEAAALRAARYGIDRTAAAMAQLYRGLASERDAGRKALAS